MKKLNNKGFGVVEVIILLIVLSLAGGAGFYVHKHNKSTTSKPTTETQSEEHNNIKQVSSNQPFTYHDVDFTVYKYDTNPITTGDPTISPEKSNGEQPKSGNKFVAVYIKAVSHAKDSNFIPHELLLKIDDRYFDDRLKLGTGLYTDNKLPDSQIDLALANTDLQPFRATFISPGETMEGYLIYEIPQSANEKPLLVITDGQKKIVHEFNLPN